jgi:glucose/arabinose dehydrogenase
MKPKDTTLDRTRKRLKGAVVILISISLSMTLPPSALADLPPGGTFTDDDGNTHEGAIEAISAEEITRGCNPPFGDRYCPEEPVTRGQMAAFLRRALNLAPSNQDFFSDDDNSTFEADINAIAQDGITKGCNPPTNDQYCPDDAVSRDQMASFLARARGLAQIVPPPRPPLAWEVVVGGLASPVQALAPPGESRLLIAEQGGLVRVFEDDAIDPVPFLDLRDEVDFGGERGLLSIALHPAYPSDRRLFAWFHANNDHTRLVEYDISPDLETASSPRTILSVAQPFGNHNGGFVDFGSDGYLYLGLGDGGGSNDPGARARDLGTLLGKMLRIDVDGAHPYEVPPDNPYIGKPGRDEIWASGLRNPWRWSFDEGFLYIGDVGQGAREEIDVVALSPTGYDFGWSRFEGSLCNPDDTDPSCSTSGLTFPAAEYRHSSGRSVTGGIVYRGPTVKSLHAYYLYADVFSGLLRAFRLRDGSPVEPMDLSSEIGMTGIVSFGEDAAGELLAVSLFDGTVYRLVGG